LALQKRSANIVAGLGQGLKTETEAKSSADSFKKKLEDCEEVLTSFQQTAMSGSASETDGGIQEDSGAADQISGIHCIYEGFDMPSNPSDVVPALAGSAIISEAIPAATVDAGMQDMSKADGQQAGGVPELNAWMQNTTAGENPVMTQDEILKAVGAYLDAADVGAKSAGAQTRTVPEVMAEQAQTAAPKQPKPAEAQAAQVTGVTVTDAAQHRTDADTAGRQSGMPGSSGMSSGDEAGAAYKTAAPAVTEGSYAAASEADGGGAAAPGKRSAAAVLPDNAGKQQPAGMPAETAAAAGDAVSDISKAETHAAESSRYAKENVLRIVEKVSTQAKDGRYDFDVELKPDFLGKVSIRLTMEDGSIRMQIKTDDASVRGMLSDQSSSLQNALKEKGIMLESVDVTYENQASLDGEAGSRLSKNGGSRQSSAYYPQAETAGVEPAAEAVRLLCRQQLR
jgi:flagellar hook-length control protein FliK